jgi:Ca2+-binding EF-hand superfamily protein
MNEPTQEPKTISTQRGMELVSAAVVISDVIKNAIRLARDFPEITELEQNWDAFTFEDPSHKEAIREIMNNINKDINSFEQPKTKEEIEKIVEVINRDIDYFGPNQS